MGTSFAIDVPQFLVERLKRGDMRALEEVYAPCGERVYERV